MFEPKTTLALADKSKKHAAENLFIVRRLVVSTKDVECYE